MNEGVKEGKKMKEGRNLSLDARKELTEGRMERKKEGTKDGRMD